MTWRKTAKFPIRSRPAAASSCVKLHAAARSLKEGNSTNGFADLAKHLEFMMIKAGGC